MPTPSTPKIFFTSLRMRHWRNFKGPVDMKLHRRAFLIGPNASGKSNILDALRFLRDTAMDGLEKAVNSRGGMGEIRTLQATQPAGIEIAVTLGSDEEREIWRYKLKFRNHPQKHHPEVMEEEVFHHDKSILRRPDNKDKKDPARLAQTYLEQVSANQKFRWLNGFMKSIRYLHIVPHLIRDPDRSVGKRDDPFGGDFLEKMASIPTKTREARLRKISKALEVAIPQFKSLELKKDAGGRHISKRASTTGGNLLRNSMNVHFPMVLCV